MMSKPPDGLGIPKEKNATRRTVNFRRFWVKKPRHSEKQKQKSDTSNVAAIGYLGVALFGLTNVSDVLTF